MYRILEDTRSPISEEDLAALERQLESPLPPEYAAFLRTQNGGSPTPDTVTVQAWPQGGPDTDVRMLYGYGSDPRGDTYDLRWNLDCYVGRMPSGLLPIATTSCGDQLCLWLTGDLRGAVVLWDHQAEHHPPTHSNLHFVAPSFTAFLDLLTEAPDA
jgi:hypothetical protein